MTPRHLTEQQFVALVTRRDTDTVGGGVEGHASTLGARGRLVTRREPVSNPAPPPTYRSKWEAAYASKLELEKRAGLIKAWWYEPFSLWLPGKVRYKPDFLIEMPYIPGMERHLEIIEVKGWSKNRRDGMTRLKIAAAIYNCFVWRLVYRTKNGGWDGEYM